MTIAVKEQIQAARPWRRLWQAPLLIAGVVLFGFGVRALVRTIKPVPFERQVLGVRQLLAAEQYPKAIEQINVLAQYYKEKAQQGELEGLSGDSIYLIQKKAEGGSRETFEQVIKHYEKAVELGVIPTAAMNERWGEAALAVGEVKVAMEKLEAAIADEPGLMDEHARELVTAYAAMGEITKAQAVLDRLLAKEMPEERTAAAVDQRVWALCKQLEMAIGLRGDVKGLEHAVEKAREALKEIPERDPSGRILTWLGRAALEQGKINEAEIDLAEAREHFILHHEDDGRAAILLAKIAESKSDRARAATLYEEVSRVHAGTAVWAAARLGRAEAAARKLDKNEESLGEQTAGDYRFAIQAVTGKGGGRQELITRAEVQRALAGGYERSAEAGALRQALVYLALDQELGDGSPDEQAARAFRTAATKEKLGEAELAEASKLEAPARAEKEVNARDLLAEAAEAYQQHAKLTTMQDVISGNSLWKAAGLFDRAGRPMKSVAVYEQFTIQRPRDPRVSEGLLSVGRLYQSAGMFDKAIAAYERNMKENPRTPATYTSVLNVARCYMALGENVGVKPEGPEAANTNFLKAEKALLSLVQENNDLKPSANEFRASLFTLGELYYRNRRWADAILRLEEAVERYPDDSGMPRTLFMLAESFRKSAVEIGEAVKKDPAMAGRDALEAARAERLQQAAGLFGRVIGALDVEQGGAVGRGRKLTALEEEYLRASYMDRAECYFDRGEFGAAIKLYDDAATRFSEETLAVRAYVQIINGYLALKEPTQAVAAAERGQWILKRIPDEAFAGTAVAMGRGYYEKLLALGKN